MHASISSTSLCQIWPRIPSCSVQQCSRLCSPASYHAYVSVPPSFALIFESSTSQASFISKHCLKQCLPPNSLDTPPGRCYQGNVPWFCKPASPLLLHTLEVSSTLILIMSLHLVLPICNLPLPPFTPLSLPLHPSVSRKCCPPQIPGCSPTPPLSSPGIFCGGQSSPENEKANP